MSNNSKVKTKKAKLQFKTQNFKFLLVVFTFTFYLLPFICYAQAISSSELINNAKQYDGKTVVYQGEVIGDIMKRANFAWININDGQNALGIWILKDLTKDIVYTGSYKFRGDIIEITGIFHRACVEHGGDLDIHAQSLRKTSAGRYIQERLNPAKRNQVIILLGILCLIWILTLLKRR